MYLLRIFQGLSRSCRPFSLNWLFSGQEIEARKALEKSLANACTKREFLSSMNYTYLCGWFIVALLTVSGKTSTCMAVLSRYVSVMPYPDTLWFSSLKPMKLTADYSKVLYWYLQPPQYTHQPQFNSRCCPMFDYRERFAGQGLMTPTTTFRNVSLNSDLAAVSHHLTTTWDFVICWEEFNLF